MYVNEWFAKINHKFTVPMETHIRTMHTNQFEPFSVILV